MPWKGVDMSKSKNISVGETIRIARKEYEARDAIVTRSCEGCAFFGNSEWKNKACDSINSVGKGCTNPSIIFYEKVAPTDEIPFSGNLTPFISTGVCNPVRDGVYEVEIEECAECYIPGTPRDTTRQRMFCMWEKGHFCYPSTTPDGAAEAKTGQRFPYVIRYRGVDREQAATAPTAHTKAVAIRFKYKSPGSAWVYAEHSSKNPKDLERMREIFFIELLGVLKDE